MKKIIYTFWVKPLILDNSLYEYMVYFLLSIHLAKQQSKNIKIYTDDFGKFILNKFFSDLEIDTSIINQFNNLQKEKWSIPKLYSINNEKKPFIHIDHDVFMWDPIILLNENFDITVQNEEIGGLFPSMYKTSFYRYFNNNYYSKSLVL